MQCMAAVFIPATKTYPDTSVHVTDGLGFICFVPNPRQALCENAGSYVTCPPLQQAASCTEKWRYLLLMCARKAAKGNCRRRSLKNSSVSDGCIPLRGPLLPWHQTKVRSRRGSQEVCICLVMSSRMASCTCYLFSMVGAERINVGFRLNPKP